MESLNPKRAFAAGLLVLLALVVTSCSLSTRSEQPKDSEDTSPRTVTIHPGDKFKLDLPGTTDGGDPRWKTDAPATITGKGVFTAPSRIGAYQVTAEYTRWDGTLVTATGYVAVTPVGKSGDDFSVDEAPKAADPASLELVLEVVSQGATSNGGKAPSFTLTQPRRVREITTYHWNDGNGTAAGGTITLKGPGIAQAFKANRTGAGQGGVPNAVWMADLDVTLQPGTYTVSDSDPSTWAQNSETKGLGMTWVRAEKR